MYKSKLISIKEFIKILNNLSPNYQIRVYHKKKKGPIHHPGDNIVKTSRLDRIEASIANLAEKMDSGFKQVNNRIDNLENDVNSLKQDVKGVNARLDYIVKANNLKDSK